MATVKKPRKRGTTARKLCSKVIRQEGLKKDGTLKKGYHYKNGKPVKAKPATKAPMKRKTTAKKGLGLPTPVKVCIRTNADRSRTITSMPPNGKCAPGTVSGFVQALNGSAGFAEALAGPRTKRKPAAKKTAKRKPAAKKK
ncbi:MAG TPA: hypothetical protein VF581_07660 [Flavobacterium sp.]|jgi:hypothetical protein